MSSDEAYLNFLPHMISYTEDKFSRRNVKMDQQEVKLIPVPEITENEMPPQVIVKKRSPLLIIVRAIPVLLMAVSVTFFVSTAISLFKVSGVDKILLTRMALGRFTGGLSSVQYLGTSSSHVLDKTKNPLAQAEDTKIPGNSSISAPVDNIPDGYTIQLNNETPYTPDMTAILHRPRAIGTYTELVAEYGADAPIVLIIHTHGTEAYADCADSSYRTEDKSKNIVSIGKIISDKLNSAGITTIHSDKMFDADDFNMAYYNASLEIRRMLEEYPSIKYIIDVHRDSVELSDGTFYPLKASVNGEIAAQLMFVVGTDHGGSGHTGWVDNLALAARIQASIATETPTLMRNVNLRSASFNQQYTSGSLILEVGSCGNTLEEAKISADIFAEALISEIKG